jgi:CMP-N-acetylneuraminic acid synthetase
MHTKWAKVKPQKQLANMSKAIKEILVVTAGKEILSQGKKYQMDYRNRNLGTKVH